MLAIFVPQACPSGTSTIGNTTEVQTGECTFEQNLYIDIDAYNAFALASNFFTVCCVFFGFWFESHRDSWLLAKFKAIPSLPDDALQKALGPRTHPENQPLYRQLAALNRQYLGIFKVVVSVYVFNAVVSGILVFKFFYINYRTATTFLSSLLLVGTKMYNSLALAQQSIDAEGNCRAESINMMEPTAFNSIIGSGESAAAVTHSAENPLRGETSKTWTCIVEGEEQWYESNAGELVWDLPEGEKATSTINQT